MNYHGLTFIEYKGDLPEKVKEERQMEFAMGREPPTLYAFWAGTVATEEEIKTALDATDLVGWGIYGIVNDD